MERGRGGGGGRKRRRGGRRGEDGGERRGTEMGKTLAQDAGEGAARGRRRFHSANHRGAPQEVQLQRFVISAFNFFLAILGIVDAIPVRDVIFLS